LLRALQKVKNTNLLKVTEQVSNNFREMGVRVGVGVGVWDLALCGVRGALRQIRLAEPPARSALVGIIQI
jgi:hypothetical protein